jgi:D-3-phosphoglycerate dehydrogenase
MPTALLTDADRFPFAHDEIDRLARAGISVTEVAGHDAGDIGTTTSAATAAAMFVYSATVDADLLDALPGCRIVMRCGSGYERIDVDAAQARGVDVSYVPGYGSVDVAEHALMLMLACARRVVDAATAVRAGSWPPYADIGRMHRLQGRTLGLIGYGRIARELAGMANGLGMPTVAYDPFVPDDTFRADGVERLDLVDVVRAADVLSVHVPLTAETDGMVDDELLQNLKPGSLFVNASRGELVDEDALVRALASGRLAGAGLDVTRVEPPDPTSQLLTLPNVVLTPHSAAFTDEALASVRGQAVDEVIRVLGGAPPEHPVPEQRKPADR